MKAFLLPAHLNHQEQLRWHTGATTHRRPSWWPRTRAQCYGQTHIKSLRASFALVAGRQKRALQNSPQRLSRVVLWVAVGLCLHIYWHIFASISLQKRSCRPTLEYICICCSSQCRGATRATDARRARRLWAQRLRGGWSMFKMAPAARTRAL